MTEPSRFPDPGTLAGRSVRLEPLTLDHAPDLLAAQSESRATYAFTWVPDTAFAMRSYVAQAVRLRDEGLAYPFATIDQRSGRVVGTTRFANLVRFDWPPGSPFDRGPGLPDDVEIGWTWLAASAQRTHINTEAKYLMFAFAFEQWGVRVVRLVTDARNERSRAAIERVGAKLDGVLRAQRAASDGTLRDSAYFSLRDFEWPAVKSMLEARMAR